MARHSKPRKLGTKSDAPKREASDLDEPARDPLRAYPADPPRPNRALLILAVVLFAAWFVFLAYVALR